MDTSPLPVASAPAGLPTAPLQVQSAPQGVPAAPLTVTNQPPAPALSVSQPPPAPAATVAPPQQAPQISNVTTANGQPIAQPPLSDDQRQQLDAVVQKMIANGESDANIQAVVNDFKQKAADSGTADTQPKSVGGYLLNQVGATGSLIADTVKSLVNVINPDVNQNTVAKLGALLGGAVESVFTGGQKSSATFDQFVKVMSSKYSSWDNFKNALYTDTPGVLLDAASVLDPAGKVLGLTGDLSKIDALSKAGEFTGKVAEAINPINQGVNAAGKVLSTTGNLAAKTLALGTGAGASDIKETFLNPSDANAAAMRGNMSLEQIASDAKDNLQVVKDARNNAYRTALSSLKESSVAQDVVPIQNAVASKLTSYGINVAADELTGKPILDFSASTIADPAEQAKVSRIFNDVSDWKDNTAIGLDTLKRRVAGEFSPNSDVRGFVTGVKNSIADVLNKNVPGYEKMTTNYAKASDFIDEIQKTLSMNDRASVETGIKKLTAALRDNNPYRTELVQQLQEAGGKDITGAIAGNALNPLFAKGLFGRFIEGGSVLHGVGAMLHPAMLAGIAATSPRLVGELTRAAGLAAKALGKVSEAIPASAKTGIRSATSTVTAATRGLRSTNSKPKRLGK